jgi:hypothetical protein
MGVDVTRVFTTRDVAPTGHVDGKRVICSGEGERTYVDLPSCVTIQTVVLQLVSKMPS